MRPRGPCPRRRRGPGPSEIGLSAHQLPRRHVEKPVAPPATRRPKHRCVGNQFPARLTRRIASATILLVQPPPRVAPGGQLFACILLTTDSSDHNDRASHEAPAIPSRGGRLDPASASGLPFRAGRVASAFSHLLTFPSCRYRAVSARLASRLRMWPRALHWPETGHPTLLGCDSTGLGWK